MQNTVNQFNPPANPLHPEAENPNEPLWNSMLLLAGIATLGLAGVLIFLL